MVVSCVVLGQNRMKNRAAACPSAVVGAEGCAFAAGETAGRSQTVRHSRLREGRPVVEDQRMAGRPAYRRESCCRASGRMLLYPG